ncbi:MAG TPA: sodium-dependent bicarbonate transport family permease [Rhodospirillaceae bacterium]|nr:sodium-dependent bicarbonate transport family permease [Rhodospirillaceae bacterium]MAX62153.1 sodium-dependent bicarbonate transport family permease [Rhodospirillaceae bacterium]MBB56713.1 sodium-dependent bicarbonate transport family permease [Rhodospirillaceae bacterium]HAE01074.1 sodium-dependent bicarbonate transport family permease [Rhodospirillaceae bacterium]HBM12888.1 sodium-dependent bicarbonate transport family permease [Rhodospirillaceae bacterium]
MDWALAIQNLISPPVLFFALGLVAALARSDLSIPEAIAKALSLYLMLAIGFKGGVAASENGLTVDLLLVIGAAGLLSASIPILAFWLLRTTTRVSQIDAAAIAAHYGSISIVTFIAGTAALDAAGIAFPGIMVAAAAAMEAPAIAIALFLAHRGQAGTPQTPKAPWREVALNGSIVLLIGAFIIGMVTGQKGYSDIEPFIADPFKGVLCLFLLDMGLVAGRELRQVRKTLTPALLAFGLYMPPIAGVIGGVTGALIGLPDGGIALLAILSGSASYIAVPAAMRLALPQAKPALYLTLSLAITFPFNLTIGIPFYIALAGWLS